MDKTTRDLFSRIAKMEAMGVANGDIARATGLSAGRITQIQSNDEYKLILTEASADNLERNIMMNKGWDSVEEQSLAIVVENLVSVPDPDYALKAAALANKAQRRNAGNRTLEPGRGNFAVINLNASFVEKVNRLFEEGGGENGGDDGRTLELPKKDSDFLPPNAVEKLLGTGIEEAEQSEQIMSKVHNELDKLNG